MPNQDPYPTYPTGAGAASSPDMPGGTTAQGLKDRVSGATSQAKEKASEFGRTAVQKMDQGRQSAAGALQNTASSLRHRVEAGGSKLSNAANATANKLESTANYMRDHDMRAMMGDVEGAIRRNPGPALLCAAAFGFLLGTALRRDSHYRS
jgi:ElaB/YqjD/DUF883 family membrane-anchored ribosome-binding protein